MIKESGRYNVCKHYLFISIFPQTYTCFYNDKSCGPSFVRSAKQLINSLFISKALTIDNLPSTGTVEEEETSERKLLDLTVTELNDGYTCTLTTSNVPFIVKQVNTANPSKPNLRDVNFNISNNECFIYTCTLLQIIHIYVNYSSLLESTNPVLIIHVRVSPFLVRINLEFFRE